jgi:hypothetical protein
MTFVVGATDGALESYAAIEMDDSIIAETCVPAGVQFGFVRETWGA